MITKALVQQYLDTVEAHPLTLSGRAWHVKHDALHPADPEAELAVVLLSGGQDSTTALYWAAEHWSHLITVAVNYGQRHHMELVAANGVAANVGRVVEHIELDATGLLGGRSPLVNHQAEVPRYTTDTLRRATATGKPDPTVVAGRNLLLLTLAANVAHTRGIADLVIGTCRDDMATFPDCTHEFLLNAQAALRSGLASPKLKIHTPLLALTKAESVALATNLPGCYPALAFTHTSYDPEGDGTDHASLLRSMGFQAAGLADPLVLRRATEGEGAIPDTANYAVFREPYEPRRSEA